MLSYQHGYHAGGPADVHKHLALYGLADYLARKEKPFCAVDAFAGDGIYNLTESLATKTREFERGIAALWDKATEIPSVATDYLTAVRGLNPDGNLQNYPGSPAILKALLRADDQLIVNELHPAAATSLRRWARNDARIAVHARDGLEALVALVPPAIRRGLVIVDPSYEGATDYADTAQAVMRAARKWPTGIFVIWYPMLADQRHTALLSPLETDLALPMVISELSFDLPGLTDDPSRGLRGSGLAVINPPWQFDQTLAETGQWLTKALPLGRNAAHTLRWSDPPP